MTVVRGESHTYTAVLASQVYSIGTAPCDRVLHMFLANFLLSSRATEGVQQKAAATHYDARILKLRLPEQDSLKNEAERCSADSAALAAIGRAVGQQVRITRTDDA